MVIERPGYDSPRLPIAWEPSPSTGRQLPDSSTSNLFKTTFCIAGLTLAVVLGGRAMGGLSNIATAADKLAQFKRRLPALIDIIVGGGGTIELAEGSLLSFVRKGSEFQDHARAVVFGRWRGAPDKSELRTVLDRLLGLIGNPPEETRFKMIRKAGIRGRHKPIVGPFAEVARLLITKRESLRLSQGAVATGSGVDRSYYCRLEGGEACRPYSLLRILRFLDQSVPFADREMVAIYRAWRPAEIRPEWFNLEKGIFWVKLPPPMTLNQAIALPLSRFVQRFLREGRGRSQETIARAIGREGKGRGSVTDIISGASRHLKLGQLLALARLGRVDGSLAYLVGRRYLPDFFEIRVRGTDQFFRHPVANRFDVGRLFPSARRGV